MTSTIKMRHIVKPRNKCAFLTAIHYRKLWGQQYRLITSAKTALEEERSQTAKQEEGKKMEAGNLKYVKAFHRKRTKLKADCAKRSFTSTTALLQCTSSKKQRHP